MSNKRVKKRQKSGQKHRKSFRGSFSGDIILDVDSKLLQGSEQDEVVECHMEISDEMVDFFAQSAMHRKQRGNLSL